MDLLCIKNHPDKDTGVKKGTKWPLLGMKRCAHCGLLAFDIGLRIPKGYRSELDCECGSLFISKTRRWYINSAYFQLACKMQAELSETTIADIIQTPVEI